MEEDEMEQEVSLEENSQETEQTLSVTEVKPIETPGPMKIVKDYVQKGNILIFLKNIYIHDLLIKFIYYFSAYALKGTNTEKPTQICPRCNQAIPVDEMDDHVRIELLDPRWKEQKMAAEAKKKESNLLREGIYNTI